MLNTNYERVTVKPDQSYIWTYHMNLFKDTSVIISVTKIILLGLSFPYLLVMVLALFEGNFSRDFFAITSTFFYLSLFMILLLAFSYYIVYLPLHGNKYTIIYEMNNNTIRFIESKKDTHINEVVSSIGIIVGALAGNPTTAGANLLSLSNSEMTTEFKHVSKVIIYKHQHLKLISKDLTRNLICYHIDDKQFVESYIIDHCPTARIIKK